MVDVQRAKILAARELVQAALDTVAGANDQAHKILRGALDQLNNLLQAETPEKYAGSILYTLDDEDHATGRQFDLRVHYGWLNYDPADEPQAVWGPTIGAVDVVAVRYFDDAGEAQSIDEDHREAGWRLVQEQYDQVIEACKQDGVRSGVGQAPAWYTPPSSAVPSLRLVARMAPSIPTRAARTRRRHG